MGNYAAGVCIGEADLNLLEHVQVVEHFIKCAVVRQPLQEGSDALFRFHPAEGSADTEGPSPSPRRPTDMRFSCRPASQVGLKL